MKGILAHSYLPLKVITVAGFALSAISLVALVILSLTWVLVGVPFAGFGTIVALTLLAFGLLASMIGVLAEYLGLVYEEVKARPNFVVAERVNFLGVDDQPPAELRDHE